MEVAIGMSVPSQGGGAHPSIPATSSPATKEVGIGCVEEPVSGALDIHWRVKGRALPLFSHLVSCIRPQVEVIPFLFVLVMVVPPFMYLYLKGRLVHST